MAEYKTFFLAFKLFVNFIAPLFFLEKDKLIVSLYFITLFFLSIALIYIKYKKVSYFKKYLSREYIPSTKLVLSVSTVDILAVCLLHISLHLKSEDLLKFKIDYKDKDLSKSKICVTFFHVMFSLITFILLFKQRTRNRAIISYTKHTYQIGIVARDIGENENGLRKGQPVEIVSESADEYVVKDSSNNNYVLKKTDHESILDVV
jgi:hypothetical protein